MVVDIVICLPFPKPPFENSSGRRIWCLRDHSLAVLMLNPLRGVEPNGHVHQEKARQVMNLSISFLLS